MTSAASIFAEPPALPDGLPAGCVMRSVVVPAARSMAAAALTEATFVAYSDLQKQFLTAGVEHVVRVWNFVPAILESTGPGTNRYMAFNAGRYAAMREWFGDQLSRLAPAGTGVGIDGEDLIIHGLASPVPGTAVQNPRQTPPVDYSARYGAQPPCFARATRIGRLLLVSGTAGISGEDTVAPNELPQQLELTLQHLAALAGDLKAYRSIRVYVPRAGDVEAVRQRLAMHLPQLGDIQPIVTDLCRPELRVEIEGVADDSGRP